ncbi:LCP family protein [Merismopedia glauca]|uniref:LytR family transcriptional regulator n=1 Tax=Merismopedia glauca CCAP 1448/3 TaxID=1296344 RepID=A0A2T1C8C9_9CYAN|nr:LCP family protein [Merismopedia glauca]PSB04532.1 LytR family transcriptional regulator [Merismopedia glauca CCAP 1448/3]
MSNRQPHHHSGKNSPKTAHKSTRKQQVSWLGLSLVLLAIASVSAAAGALLAVSLSTTPLLQQKLSPEEAAIFNQGKSFSGGDLHLPQVTRPVNILVMGMSVLSSDVDNPPPDSQNLRYKAQVNSFKGLADTMLLVRLNPDTKKIIMLSIPRDTRVELEAQGVQKINTTNILGGPALTAKTVTNLLQGVEIDRYLRVNVAGVEKLVDALGGVTVNVPKDLKYRDDSQHLYIDLKKGKQHLNGNQVLQLLRFRHDALGDLGRIQRQQAVMQAILEQSLTPATVAKIPELIPTIQGYIDTNLKVEELLAVASFVVQTKSDRPQSLILPGDFNGNGRNGVSYWLPNENKIKTLVAQYFGRGEISSGIIQPSRVRVAIQDSTGDRQAVQALVKKLTAAGYKNIYIAEPIPEPLGVTRTIAQQGDEASAKAIQTQLGLGEVRVEASGNVGSDVTIQVGKDWLQQNQNG